MVETWPKLWMALILCAILGRRCFRINFHQMPSPWQPWKRQPSAEIHRWQCLCVWNFILAASDSMTMFWYSNIPIQFHVQMPRAEIGLQLRLIPGEYHVDTCKFASTKVNSGSSTCLIQTLIAHGLGVCRRHAAAAVGQQRLFGGPCALTCLHCSRGRSYAWAGCKGGVILTMILTPEVEDGTWK